jgi:hypothetical protein
MESVNDREIWAKVRGGVIVLSCIGALTLPEGACALLALGATTVAASRCGKIAEHGRRRRSMPRSIRSITHESALIATLLLHLSRSRDGGPKSVHRPDVATM